MSSVYELIGRTGGPPRLVALLTQIKIAGAIGLVGVGVAGWLAATREPPEG